MTTEPSIFTKIINGEIPGYIPYQDEIVAVLIALEGHVLVVPKIQYENIYELPEDTGAHIMKIAIKTAKALKQITNSDGINLVQSNGTAAGQEVFHFHLHIKQRFHNDDVMLRWNTDPKSVEERSILSERLASAM